ncbi:MAG: hypothetical protein LC797_03910 [Chloroflexi bacterium]|nr:hypothetical protein [Chloroflexota bacterium]
MVALALLLVADVGVRRVRISMLELRAGYAALRRRLGYSDDPRVAGRIAVATAERADAAPQPVGLVASPGAHRALSPRTRSPAAATHSGRLLAAKRRAGRR